jgi:hypothetical protein
MNHQKTKLVRNISDFKLRNLSFIQELNLQDEMKINLTFPRNYSLLSQQERETLLNDISTRYSQYKIQLCKFRKKGINEPIPSLIKEASTTTKGIPLSMETRQKISQAVSGKRNYRFTYGSITKKNNSFRFRWRENGKHNSKSFLIGEGGEIEALQKIEEWRKTVYPDYLSFSSPFP